MADSVDSDFLHLIRYLFKRGPSAFLVILGRRGTGKTSLGLTLMEIAKQEGIIHHFATNVKVYASPFPIDEIAYLDDLRDWCQQNSERKLFLFDEIGKAMPRRRPMSSLNVELINEFHILRKYKLSIVATTISADYTDNAVLGSDILDGRFTKPNYENPKIVLYDDYLEDISESFHDLDDTKIRFDTWDSSPFREHSPQKKPLFKDGDLNVLWDLTHGKRSAELGLDNKQVARLWRKYVKASLERERDA